MQAYGGPLMPDSMVEFVVEGYDGVLEISKGGLLRALMVGVQKVTARSVGSEGDVTVVHSEVNFQKYNIYISYILYNIYISYISYNI